MESLRQSSLGHSTQQTRRHVPSRVAFGKNTDSSRRRRRGARTAVDVSPMAVGPGMESDSRIRGDPAALERWLSGGGGIIGPVVLEGVSHCYKPGINTSLPGMYVQQYVL